MHTPTHSSPTAAAGEVRRLQDVLALFKSAAQRPQPPTYAELAEMAGAMMHGKDAERSGEADAARGSAPSAAESVDRVEAADGGDDLGFVYIFVPAGRANTRVSQEKLLRAIERAKLEIARVQEVSGRVHARACAHTLMCAHAPSSQCT